MKITYDPKADAMYIYVKDTAVSRTEELQPGVMRDLDDQGEVVGLEVLSVRERVERGDAGWSVDVPTAKAADSMGDSVHSKWLDHLNRMARPPLEALAEGRLKATMPVEAHPDRPHADSCTYLECFGRLLSGIAPFLAAEGLTGQAESLRVELLDMARTGLDRATNDDDADRMNFSEGGQPLVDAAFLSIGLIRGRTALWDPLDDRVKRQLVNCLRESRGIRPGFNNWLLFSAAVEALLCAFGEDHDAVRIDYAIRQHEQWYLGGGVYGDGPRFAADYYNSYVIQPFAVDILEAVAPVRDDWAGFVENFRGRAIAHAGLQEQMINPDGTYPAVGRSITYRCGAFQSLARQAWKRQLPKGLTPAAARGALTAAIDRTLNAKNTYDENGWLRIGLAGHQPALGETYISTGSLYLAACAFLPLGLPPDAPFWADADEPWTSCRLWAGENVTRPTIKPSVG